jgi:hypothetical protein
MAMTNKEIIEAAIVGLEAQKLHIDAQIAELRAAAGGATTAPSPAPVAREGKRKISAATLRRMREGQRRRWAKTRGETHRPKQ